MPLAIFDVDYTIARCDSEQQFCVWLHQLGLVDDAALAQQRIFFEQYLAGELVPEEGSQNIIAPLVGMSVERLNEICREYVDSVVVPELCPHALDRIERHREQGDILMLASATTACIIEPLGEYLDIEHVIATRPEIVADKVTGKIQLPCAMGEGKAELVLDYVSANKLSLEGSWAYSDSRNDFPLLALAQHKVAVNADSSVRAEATKHNWEICDWALDRIDKDR